MKFRPNARRFSRITTVSVIAALLAIAGFSASPPAMAESVEVIVNNKPITTVEIRNRTRFLQITTRGRAKREQAVEQLIDEQLKMQVAAQRSISVTDEEVERSYGQIARRAKMTPARLSQALGGKEIVKTLKNRVRSEIAWSRIVSARFRATVKITERDVAEALAGKETAGDADAILQFELQPILFVIPAKANKGFIDQRRREAEAFRGRYAGCDQALDQTKKLKNVFVDKTIRKTAKDLRGPAAESITQTAVGQATRPEKVPRGYQLLGVCAKRDLAGQTTAGEEVRNEVANKLGSQMARRYLHDLRSQAIIEYTK